MSFEELAGMLHHNQNLTAPMINEILTFLQGQNDPIDDDSDYELDVVANLYRIRHTTINFTQSVTIATQNRGRHNGLYSKRIPANVTVDELVQTDSGTVTFETLAGSKFGCGVVNTATGYSYWGNHTKLNFATAAFSVGVHLKFTGTGTNRALICKKDLNVANSAGYVFYVNGTTITFIIADGTASNTISIAVAGINNGNWHNIIINVPASGSNMECFVDGVSKQTVARTVGSVSNTRNMYSMGLDTNGSIASLFSGTLALLVTKHEIFSAGQITAFGNGVVDLSSSSAVEGIFVPYNYTTQDEPLMTVGLFVAT